MIESVGGAVAAGTIRSSEAGIIIISASSTETDGKAVAAGTIEALVAGSIGASIGCTTSYSILPTL